MDVVNLPFQNAQKEIMTELLENINAVLKDSDAPEEKKLVKELLHSVSQAFTFVAVGNAGVGKSSFLQSFFHGCIYGEQEIGPTVGIHEIRNGEHGLVVRVDRNVTRHFVQEESLQGLCVIDMQGLRQLAAVNALEAAERYAGQGDVLFVVFEVGSVSDCEVWELLGQKKASKIIFILTKCDLAEQEEIDDSILKIRRYMADEGIQAPVFPVSAVWEEEGEGIKNNVAAVRDYVSRNMTGSDPVLAKQWDNILQLKEMVKDLSASFACRKMQYEEDTAILRNIDRLMDAFRVDSGEQIETLKETLTREIEGEIDRFQDEIIMKLDPMQIKERFPKGSTDFIEYMDFVNEAYRKRLTEHVNRKTESAVKSYMSRLEGVFQDAVGCFQKRESLMKLEDRFYGTIAETKISMTGKTSHNLQVVGEYCRTLNEASKDLFSHICAERNRFEQKVQNGKMLGGVFGAAGLWGGSGALGAMMEILSTSQVTRLVACTALEGALDAMLLAAIPCIISGIFIGKMAGKISAAKNQMDLEKRVRECIAEFRTEVAHTRKSMISDVLGAVDSIFESELDVADKSFLDFRMSVNIDSRNVPALEERLRSVQELLGRIERMQEEKIPVQ